jgi:hypothetical protein
LGKRLAADDFCLVASLRCIRSTLNGSVTRRRKRKRSASEIFLLAVIVRFIFASKSFLPILK